MMYGFSFPTFSQNISLRFGKIIDNPKFINKPDYSGILLPSQDLWETRTVFDQGQDKTPLATVKQAKDSEVDVSFFQGKRGNNVVVKTPNATYIALPGCKLVFPDTEIDLPGEKLVGKLNSSAPDTGDTTPQTITKQAMLLCGGLSSRFEPVSGPNTNLPKPAVEILEDESIAKNIINHLKAHGFTKVIVHTFYLREQVKKALESVEGVEIQYLDDPHASGSAGGLFKALKNGMVDKNQDILILAGDAVTNGNLSDLVRAHKANDSSVTIGVQQVGDEDVNQFGIIQTDDPSGVGSGEIISFLEKPSLADAGPNRLGSTGIYVLSPKSYETFLKLGEDILDAEQDTPIEKRIYDYGMNFLPTWLKNKLEHALTSNGKHMWAERLKGYWNDVGNPIDYLRTIRDMAEGKMGAETAARAQQCFQDGVMLWKGAAAKAQSDAVQVEGNVIVAPIGKNQLA
jgi:NDP-sugar pyrophosphorylase family protein